MIDFTGNEILSIEETDPEMSRFFQDISHKKNPYGIKKVVETDKGIIFIPAPFTVKKVGRNDLCSCGSGKKYKKCCGKL